MFLRMLISLHKGTGHNHYIRSNQIPDADPQLPDPLMSEKNYLCCGQLMLVISISWMACLSMTMRILWRPTQARRINAFGASMLATISLTLLIFLHQEYVSTNKTHTIIPMQINKQQKLPACYQQGGPM
jgi:hypothetical protein